MSFSWTQIASILGVSRMTIYQRMLEYGLNSSASGSLSDNELRVILDEIRRDQPTLGETMTWGRLRSMGSLEVGHSERLNHYNELFDGEGN